MQQRDRLIIDLNGLTLDKKEAFWLSNQYECQYKESIKDGALEYNWYYFNKTDIWMCRLYDYDRLKEGKGVLSEVVFYKEKEDLLLKNKQWSVL